MPELLATYWPYLLIAFLVGLAIAWFAFAANRKTSIKRHEDSKKDVLDEGAAPAARNDALIKAPPAASTLSEAANSQKVTHASATADAETGAAVVPSKPPTPSSASSGSGADDLTRIKGLGPKLSAMLQEQGITTFAQIAEWSDADVDRIDAGLGRFQGRIRRDSWVDQAKMLAAGDEIGFANQFGNTQ
ncbi:hypothetical protein [Altererythrobacter lutimaris]|uniref:Uncharacterized protein n=1 Tax=Altererythrobacter lutimaris TaxID=2743979 RepID=A0A850HAM3_9SPHN|nr:hypothetical protein [Altererythrobacter lutimaris]NVE93518.1 hypothetical protein [Altererythrobacter lutimaris]